MKRSRELTTSVESDVVPQTPSVDDLTVTVLILAAGASSRMGQSKQLLPIQGSPLLVHSANAALRSRAKQVLVVLGANENPHKEILQGIPVEVVSNHLWKSGMGSSIKTGMNAMIKKFPETNGVIIMVCDQPAIHENHLDLLIKEQKTSKRPIVASSYGDTVGVPVFFARHFFSNLLMLRDDQGAKKIIQQFSSQVQTVDFPDGAFDLDTTEDYQNFINSK